MLVAFALIRYCHLADRAARVMKLATTLAPQALLDEKEAK